MRAAFRILAYVICGLVALQAAMHAWASAGLAKYIGGGGTLDMNSDAPPLIPEFTGLIVHAMNGMYVIPLIALALLVLAFMVKTPGAVRMAATVLVLVVVQVVLGFLGHEMTTMALLHGLNAMALFAAAWIAARQVQHSPTHAESRRSPVMV